MKTALLDLLGYGICIKENVRPVNRPVVAFLGDLDLDLMVPGQESCVPEVVPRNDFIEGPSLPVRGVLRKSKLTIDMDAEDECFLEEVKRQLLKIVLENQLVIVFPVDVVLKVPCERDDMQDLVDLLS